MKAELLKISSQIEHSFSSRHDVQPVYHNRWHYHPEIEILCIKKGKGKCIIGDLVADFDEYDVFLLGSNLPHLFQYDLVDDQIYSDAYVVHLPADFFQQQFLSFPEMRNVKELLGRSSRGVKFKFGENVDALELFEQLNEATGLRRIIYLYDILLRLIEIKEPKVLASIGYSHSYDSLDSKRIDSIYQYVLNNFQQEIMLDTISHVANLSSNSFCRYFKTKTGKTFTDFLLEVRIGHACRQLVETDLNISQVCYDSGFNNLSNFNRHFKKLIGKTPKEYTRHVKAK